MRPKRHLFLVIMILIVGWVTAVPTHGGEPEHNCYSILVGKDASENGAVLFAHNEDDWGDQLVNWYKVPRRQHDPQEMITLKNGGQLVQVDTTWAYLWFELPGMDFGDSYMNEWGVTIASNACPSREDRADLTDGGICYWLRRAMAERATSAREAVHIGATLVEAFGYASSGRTYSIADPNEAWMLSVVQGRHWIAQRVPDDAMAIIPNYYTITSIDLTDTLNFLASADIVDYAVERGWYVTQQDGGFCFREVYGAPAALQDMGNIARKWRGLNLLAGTPYSLEEDFPFAVKPRRKVSKAELMKTLRDHYEGSRFECEGNPHDNAIHTICASVNQYGFVAELRSGFPTEIGSVLWLAPRRPCVQPFIPIYCGSSAIPAGFAYTDFQSALEQHYNLPEDIYAPKPEPAYWVFADYCRNIDSAWMMKYPKAAQKAARLQKRLLRAQPRVERKVLKIENRNPETASQILTMYTAAVAKRLLKMSR